MSHKLLIIIGLFLCFNQIGHTQELSEFQGFSRKIYFEDSNQISRNSFQKLIKSHEASNQYWKKSRVQKTVGLLALGTGVGLGILGQIQQFDKNQELIFQYSSLASLVTSIIFYHVGHKSNRKAILTYNEYVGSIGISPSENGLGLVFTF